MVSAMVWLSREGLTEYVNRRVIFLLQKGFIYHGPVHGEVDPLHVIVFFSSSMKG